jgi:predicted MFS family arabinose efflux permease
MPGRLKGSLRAWRDETLGPLSLPVFRALWIAALASHIGAAIQTVGAQWTMTMLAPSPQMVSLVATAAMLPMVLLALPAGALADTVDRRVLMLVSQIIGACAAALLAALSFAGHITPIGLLALTSLVGVSVALHQPAWQASIGDLVPRPHVPAAVSLNVLAFNTARSIGPAIGGALIAATNPSATFLLNALSFAGLIVVLATRALPRTERRHPPERVMSAMAAGVRFVGMSPQLQRIFVRGSLFGLGASALHSLLPLIARTRLAGGPMSFGALMGAFGLGSFVGAIAATRVRSNIGGNRLLALATIGYAAATLIVAFSSRLMLSIPFSFVAGAAWIFVLTTTRTAVQLCSPRWVVGRAVSLGQVASFGCMALGAAGWGAIAARVGLDNALGIAAAFLVASTLLHRRVPLPVVENDEIAMHSPAQVPAPGVALGDHSGPIVITIEYRVAAYDAQQFLVLTSELGRARRRNGATHWCLQQDIDQPEVWIERIESSTWIDHVRRLDRYTAAERALAACAAAFRTTADRTVRRTMIMSAGSTPLAACDRSRVAGPPGS